MTCSIKCEQLKAVISENSCISAQLYGHNYCKSCNKKKYDKLFSSADTSSFVNLFVDVVKDAASNVIRADNKRIAEELLSANKLELQNYINTLKRLSILLADKAESLSWLMGDSLLVGSFRWYLDRIVESGSVGSAAAASGNKYDSASLAKIIREFLRKKDGML